jgi:hypothetical protein
MKDGHQLFSCILNDADTDALKRIAKRKSVTKSAAFREWIRNSDRAAKKVGK